MNEEQISKTALDKTDEVVSSFTREWVALDNLESRKLKILVANAIISAIVKVTE